MANDAIKWKFTDASDDNLEVEPRNNGIAFYTDCERWSDVVVPFEKARELRDWLTAKLEGNDES
jgi:hypothetical protein